jgi:Na+/H+ antiporter NhaD/arsenite permease-like protein
VKPEKVYRAVDWDLLMLFVGLFVIVGAAEKSGLSVRVFDTLRPLGVHTVAGLTVAAALLSNVISNVPAVMLFTHIIPLTPDPQRAWLTLAMASTLAGNLTILGSIANLIVVEGARRRGVAVSFGEYARVGVPLTLATLAFGAWWLS